MNITIEQLIEILVGCSVAYTDGCIVQWYENGEGYNIIEGVDDEDNVFSYTIDHKEHLILCDNVISGKDTKGRPFELQVFALAPYIYVAKK